MTIAEWCDHWAPTEQKIFKKEEKKMPEPIQLEVVRNNKKETFFEKAKNWCADHTNEIGIGAFMLASIFGAGAKIHHDRAKVKVAQQEQFNKERYIYDRSLGMYLKTTRPLNNNDYILINQRKENGEKLSNILASMGLLE